MMNLALGKTPILLKERNLWTGLPDRRGRG
jgi:hypothetical protein